MKINTKILGLLSLLIIGHTYGMDERKEERKEAKTQATHQSSIDLRTSDGLFKFAELLSDPEKLLLDLHKNCIRNMLNKKDSNGVATHVFSMLIHITHKPQAVELYKKIFIALTTWLQEKGIGITLSLFNNFYPAMVLTTADGKVHKATSQEALPRNSFSTFMNLYGTLIRANQTTTSASSAIEEPHSAPAYSEGSPQIATRRCSKLEEKAQ